MAPALHLPAGTAPPAPFRIPQARRPLEVAVVGLGHVGATMAACLAAAGHRVRVADRDDRKVADALRGRAALVEPGLEELLGRARAAGRLAATSVDEAARALDLVCVCVGTPGRPSGGLDLGQLAAAVETVGTALAQRRRREPLLVVVRSTVPPGTMEGLVRPLLEARSGGGAGERFELALNPEFLREGMAVADFLAPSRIVLGERFKGATRRLAGLYDGFDAPLLEVGFAVAEMAKLVDNSFHALKVAFANEIGRLSLALGLDPQTVGDLFLADRRLNLGPAYLRPGGPFGGMCLPKDLRATIALCESAGLEVPVLEGALRSNALHLDWLMERIRKAVPPPGPLLQLGLSFKPGTDDLRGSPLVALAERLVAAGYDLALVDPDVTPRHLAGRPALADRLVPPGAPLADPRLVLVGKPVPVLEDGLAPAIPRLDLHRLRGP
jgi:GDP-mannose 6-dehydrogenase